MKEEEYDKQELWDTGKQMMQVSEIENKIRLILEDFLMEKTRTPMQLAQLMGVLEDIKMTLSNLINAQKTKMMYEEKTLEGH